MSRQREERGSRWGWDAHRTWVDDGRWEIIAGEAYDMTPSPASRHQWVVGNLHGMLFPWFQKGPGRLFLSPMDVKLSDVDIVQPDLLVVCDSKQIQETHIDGSPALVIEVLSPSTLRHDRVRKLELYARSGVTEYWMVTPYPSLVELFVLSEAGYRFEAGFESHETLRSPTFPELARDLAAVFDFPIDPNERVNVVRETSPPHAGI